MGRATRAKARGNEERLAGAIERALELFDLMLAARRGRGGWVVGIFGRPV